MERYLISLGDDSSVLRRKPIWLLHNKSVVLGTIPTDDEKEELGYMPGDNPKGMCNQCTHRPETKCLLNGQIMQPSDFCSQHSPYVTIGDSDKDWVLWEEMLLL